jgi:hypothetical protein
MRSHVSSIASWIAAVTGLLIAAAANAQIVPIPNSSVAMAPPEGFRIARSFAGLESPQDGSNITVGELPPDGYAKLAATFSSPKTASAGFAAQGISVTRIEQVLVGSAQVPVAIGDQKQNGQLFRKYIALLGGPALGTNVVLITFNIADRSSLRQADVEKVLQSVRIAHLDTLDEKLARLPFKFKAADPFHTANVLSENTALLTTFPGTSEPSGMKPVLMITRGSTESGPEDMPKTSERILRGMSGFADAEVTDQKPVTFAGGPGYFMAMAAGGKSMLQFLRVLPNGTFVRVVARGASGSIEEARDAVTAIADSVTID